jgi:hypothetical protein
MPRRENFPGSELGESHVKVVLGDEVKIQTGLIGKFQNFEMIFV